MRYETESGRRIPLGRFVGNGGQGTVYQVRNNQLQAVKLYKIPTKKLENKIKRMTSMRTRRRPPASQAAWPLEPLYETSGFWRWKKSRFIGYTMPYIADAHPIFHFYTPKERRKRNWNFNWGHMHLLAFSLATVFKQFHDHNFVIGDVNCKNILVTSQLLPVIIDVDSIQISPKYTTDVGWEEYTPPELANGALTSVVRNKHHDLFGLGYLIFQLLMNGCSPFAGAPKIDFDCEHVDKRCKELGIFPFYDNPYVGPPRGMPTAEVFHPQIASGFISCFIKGRKSPAERPTADVWREKIMQAESVLTRCHKNYNHVYSPHLSRCPWCKR